MATSAKISLSMVGLVGVGSGLLLWWTVASPAVLTWAIHHRHAGLAGFAIRHARYRFVGPADALLGDAIRWHEVGVAGDLLRHGANVNAKWEGVAPLQLAVSAQIDGAVSLLLSHGADVNARTLGGATALLVAAPLGRVDYVTALLKAGADARAHDDRGYTPLLYTAQCGGSLGMVRLLVEHGAVVDEVHRPDGETPLTGAARSCRPEVLNYLIRVGADVHHVNFEGEDPLDCAVVQDRSDNIRELVADGVVVNRLDPHGLTALMAIASSWGRTNAIKALVALGADKSVADSKGLTAVDMARRASQFQKADLLGFEGPSHPAKPAPPPVDASMEHVPPD